MDASLGKVLGGKGGGGILLLGGGGGGGGILLLGWILFASRSKSENMSTGLMSSLFKYVSIKLVNCKFSAKGASGKSSSKYVNVSSGNSGNDSLYCDVSSVKIFSS